jgi:hypothetical protein
VRAGSALETLGESVEAIILPFTKSQRKNAANLQELVYRFRKSVKQTSQPSALRVLFLIATHAPQHLSYVLLAPLRSHHPRPHLPRRTMPYVLPMPTVELGNPIAPLILMKPDNRLLCHLCRKS